MTDASLKNLTSLSKSLNEASDALSKQIARVEAALNDLKLGIWAWVDIGRYTDDETFRVDGKPETVTRVERLGYGKYKGKWGLLYGIDYDEYPGPEFGAISFLRDAPRLEKIEAVDKIPALIKALESSAHEVTKRATDQAARVAEVAATLDRSRGRS
jgi:hypothetical protein